MEFSLRKKDAGANLVFAEEQEPNSLKRSLHPKRKVSSVTEQFEHFVED